MPMNSTVWIWVMPPNIIQYSGCSRGQFQGNYQEDTREEADNFPWSSQEQGHHNGWTRNRRLCDTAFGSQRFINTQTSNVNSHCLSNVHGVHRIIHSLACCYCSGSLSYPRVPSHVRVQWICSSCSFIHYSCHVIVYQQDGERVWRIPPAARHHIVSSFPACLLTFQIAIKVTSNIPQINNKIPPPPIYLSPPGSDRRF